MTIDNFLEQDQAKGLLRVLTAGSVDDGKSTLIGRLLFDSKRLYEDQLQALKTEAVKRGDREQDIDYSLLCDGLKAEREQGITIDVAYRYFATSQRKFIIADTPGHEQYTRNMITGGSTADVAILLVDARQGVVTQTRRHSYIVALLGIKHIILAVNKMDLVAYSKERFNEIVKSYTSKSGRKLIKGNEDYYTTINGKKTLTKSFRGVCSAYYCRNELKGTYYDRKALFAASRALGHNRESIVAEHYLSSLKT